MFTYGASSTDWINQMQWLSSYWGNSFSSEALLSSDGQRIYNLYSFGASIYFYFTVFSKADGRVLSSTYQSSINWDRVYGSVLTTDWIIASVDCTNSYLVMWSIKVNQFKMYLFSGTTLTQMISEKNTER